MKTIMRAMGIALPILVAFALTPGVWSTTVSAADKPGACVIKPNQQAKAESLGSGVITNAKSVCDASIEGCGACVELCSLFTTINDKFGCPLDGADGFCNPDFGETDPDCCTIETQITFDTTTQEEPDIDGNLIVWKDNRNGNNDIYMFDLATNKETQITSSTASQGRPAISGGKIVWDDNRNGFASRDIFMCDLSLNGGAGGCLAGDAKTQISSNTVTIFAAIDGTRIAWNDKGEDGRSPVGIFMCDLSLNGSAGGCLLDDAKTEISTTSSRSKDQPSIDGNILVFSESFRQVFMFDLATDTVTQITNAVQDTFGPIISGSNIVWVERTRFSGPLHLFMCDLSLNGSAGGCLLGDTKSEIDGPVDATISRDIDGNRITWTAVRDGNRDIFMCDLSLNGSAGGCLLGDEKTRVTTDPSQQIASAISGTNIVWTDARNSRGDIFLGDLTIMCP